MVISLLITVYNMTTNKLYEKLTLVLLVVLPINYMVFNIFLKPIPFIKYFKDIIMLCLLALTLTKKIKVKQVNSAVFLATVGIIITVFFRIVTSDNMLDSLYATRLFIVPLLFYFCYSLNSVSEAQTIKILKVLFFLSVFLAVWGIFQAFVLGDTFLIDLNYKGDTGRLSSGFYISGYRGIQRVTSTFAAPNLYSLYSNLMFFIFIAFKDELNLSKKIYAVGIILILLSSILTFSRSGWLGLAIGSMYYCLRLHRITVKQGRYFVFGGLFLLIIAVYVLSINENIYNAFSLLITRTFNNTDTSLIGHMDSFLSTTELMGENPLGYKWLGYSGPRTRLGIVNYNVESSLLLMGLELGVIGAVQYIFLFAGIILGVKNGPFKWGIQSAIFAIIPSLLLLPLLEEYELITFFLIIIVLTNNLCNIRRMKNARMKKNEFVPNN